MATKRILKLTNTEAIVKVDGTVGTATIDLQTDLLHPFESLDGAVQTVAISMLVVSGKPTGVVTITRNGVVLYNLSVDACAVVDMQSLGPIYDATEGTSDIVVGLTVVDCEVIMKLRKISGYMTRYNATGTGVYENPGAPNT
jgi:hypothetical protein